METLEQVVTDAREEIQLLRRRGDSAVATVLEEYIDRVATAAHEYMTWVSEQEAVMRGDRAAAWFRARFPEWQRQGNARWNPKNPRERQYRTCIVPVASQIDAARADARRTAHQQDGHAA